MPSFFSRLSLALRSIDLFPTSNLVRYNGGTDYTTTTGGLISIVVIAIFIILFASMGLRTLKKELITVEVDRQSEIDPSELKFITNPTAGENGMMFAITLRGVNLS